MNDVRKTIYSIYLTQDLKIKKSSYDGCYIEGSYWIFPDLPLCKIHELNQVNGLGVYFDDLNRMDEFAKKILENALVINNNKINKIKIDIREITRLLCCEEYKMKSPEKEVKQ